MILWTAGIAPKNGIIIIIQYRTYTVHTYILHPNSRVINPGKIILIWLLRIYILPAFSFNKIFTYMQVGLDPSTL